MKGNFVNNPEDLDPFMKGKTHIIAKFHRTDLIICSQSREL